MKQIKFLSILCAGFSLLTLNSCHNQEVEFPDYDYSAVYFAYQTPVRTIVLGEDIYDTSLDNQHKLKIYAAMGGVYENKSPRRPDGPTRWRSLAVLPPVARAPAGLGNDVNVGGPGGPGGGVRIAGWDTDDPLLRWVDLDDVQVSSTRRLDLGAGARALVHAQVLVDPDGAGGVAPVRSTTPLLAAS